MKPITLASQSAIIMYIWLGPPVRPKVDLLTCRSPIQDGVKDAWINGRRSEPWRAEANAVKR